MVEKPRKITTLCILHSGTHVLLGMKKRGFGEGRWNGFGGKVAPGEEIEAAARREVREECGIELSECRKRGVMTFDIADYPEIIEMHVFTSSRFQGQPAESEEMAPKWFRLVDIPYARMWADDKYWLPRVLAGEDLDGRFYFLDQETLLHYHLRALPQAQELRTEEHAI